MSVAAIKNGIVTAATKTGHAIKEAVFWTGRTIKTGFIKLGDLITQLWNKVLPHLKVAWEFLKSPKGLISVGVSLGVVAIGVTVGVVLYKTLHKNKAQA